MTSQLAGRATTYEAVSGRASHTSLQQAVASGEQDAGPSTYQNAQTAVLVFRRPAPGDPVGFCILFAFIGTFTYVNFVLVQQPFALGMMELGFVYFVFLPSVVSTPFAGRVALRCGTRSTCFGALALAALGLPLLLLPSLSAVLLGLVPLSVGTFFAQAVATGFVGRAARADRAAASGMLPVPAISSVVSWAV